MAKVKKVSKDVEKLKNENLALNKKRDELQVQIETVEQKRKIQQIKIHSSLHIPSPQMMACQLAGK